MQRARDRDVGFGMFWVARRLMGLRRGSKGKRGQVMEGPDQAEPCQPWGQRLGELAFCSESDAKPLQGSKQGDDWFRFC